MAAGQRRVTARDSHFAGVQLHSSDHLTLLTLPLYDFITYSRVQPYLLILWSTEPYWPVLVLTL
jgi:hypothetical protein